MVVVPHADFGAPILYVAVARVGPFARLDAWVCGSRAARASFDVPMRGLAPPRWIAPLAAPGSVRTFVLERRAARLAARATHAYLAALARARREDDPDAAAASLRTVTDVLRAHAPRWALQLFP
jgi:hypothetical protein